MSIRLYPSRFQPTFTPAEETATEDKWHHNHSQPVRNQGTRRAQAVMVAALAGCVLTPIAYPGDGLAHPISVTTSVRFDRTIIYDDWFSSPPLIEDTADVAIQAKWFQPLATPRAARRAAEYPAAIYSPYFDPPAAGPGAAFNWWPNLSERLRSQRPVTQQQAFAFAGKPDDPAWSYPGLDQPARITVRQNQGSFVYPYQTSVVTGSPGDGLVLPFTVSTSVRFSQTVIYDDMVLPPLPIQALPGDATRLLSWPNLSEPTRAKPRLQGMFVWCPPTYGDETTEAFTVTFGGFNYTKTVVYNDLFYTPAVVPPDTPAPGDASTLPFTVATSVQFDKTIIFDDLAFSPFPIPDAAISVLPLFAATTAVQFNKTVIYDDLFAPPYPIATPTPGAGSEFNWWPNLSERIRARLPVTQQQAVIQGPVAPYTTTLEDAWYYPLSEPVRRKLEAQTAGGVFYPFPQITISWHQALSLPTRRKTDLSIHDKLSWVYVLDSGVGVGTDQPWPPLAEPVRFKLGLSHQFQQALAFSVLPITNVAVDPPPCLIDTLGAFDNSDVPFGDVADAPLGDNSDEPFGDVADNPGSFDNEDEAPC